MPLQNPHPRRDASSLADKAAAALNSREEPAISSRARTPQRSAFLVDHGLRLVNLWSAIELDVTPRGRRSLYLTRQLSRMTRVS